MKLAIDVPHEVRSLKSLDGTLIYYLVAGTGPTPVVMCPGLGGPMISYKYLFEQLGDRYRFVTWEPRGLYRSGVPAGGRAALSVQHHVVDLERIVEAERLSRFALGGWSMGVQLALEYSHRYPEKCLALLLLNGCFGNVLQTVAGLKSAERLMMPVIRAASLAGPLLDAAARRLLDRPATIQLMLRVGIITANPGFFREVVSEFKQLNFRRYMQMIRALHEHSAEPLLPEIATPALVVVGSRDLLAPPAIGHALARRLPNAREVVIDRGTHYTLIEYPDAVNGAIEAFLAETLPKAPEVGRIG